MTGLEEFCNWTPMEWSEPLKTFFERFPRDKEMMALSNGSVRHHKVVKTTSAVTLTVVFSEAAIVNSVGVRAFVWIAIF